jgi:uncharacterized protein (DUF1330 family)
MAAYVVSGVEALDQELFNTYREFAAASIAEYGGRYLVRGGASELADGGPAPKALVIMEFPTIEIAEGWYKSSAYAQALELRKKALARRLVFVQGV